VDLVRGVPHACALSDLSTPDSTLDACAEGFWTACPGAARKFRRSVVQKGWGGFLDAAPFPLGGGRLNLCDPYINRSASDNGRAPVSREQVFLWMDSYCRGKPLSLVKTGAVALLNERTGNAFNAC
jgi:hypothetical protein